MTATTEERDDAINLDLTLGYWLGTRLIALAELGNTFPGNEEYPTFEDWDYDLRLAAQMLLTYWDLEANSRIVEFNGPGWMERYGAVRRTVDSEARLALQWVAEHLHSLWD